MSESACSIDGCNGRVRGRGWCSTHYSRWRRGGDPMIVMVLQKPTPAQFAEIFRSNFDKRGPDECWPWTGRINEDGYGRIWFTGRERPAHSVAWELATGESVPRIRETEPNRALWPAVDHECHNCDMACTIGPACMHRRCVNPAHLVLKTAAQNSRDGLTGRVRTLARRGY